MATVNVNDHLLIETEEEFDKKLNDAIHKSIVDYEVTDRYTNGEKKNFETEEYKEREVIFMRIVRPLLEEK